MRAQIKTEGFRELGLELLKLAEEVRTKVLSRAALAGAKTMGQEAKRLAPVLKVPDRRRRPGTLRDAIRWSRMRDSKLDGAAARVYVKQLSRKAISQFKSNSGKSSNENPDDPFYARFVEYGTSKMRPQPFMRRAFEARRNEAISTMKEETKVGLMREARKRGIRTR